MKLKICRSKNTLCLYNVQRFINNLLMIDGFIDIKTSFDEEYYSRKLYFVKSSYHKYDI